MKRTFLLLLAAFVASAAAAQIHIPTRDEVGAARCPEEIAPIEAPFYMPDLKRPTFPDYTVHVACPTNGDMATRAIQKAIDQTAKRGGGRVIVPAGHWHTGRITLKSNVELHLEEGCELHFSGEIEDYLPAVFTTNEGVEVMSLGACIYAHNEENIALTGKGRLIGPKSGSIKDRQVTFAVEKIDINTPVEERIYDGSKGGEVFLPTFFGPIDCKNVLLEGVRFEQGFFWNIAPVYCEEMIIRGVEVESRGIPRGDGIDITCCKYVLIEYSTMGCGDDNFAMKGGRNEYGEAIGRASENIVMRHCLTLHGHGGITCGSETAGWIRNLYTHDCVFDGTMIGIRFKTRRPRAGGGENLTYERIRMKTQKGAIVWDMLGNPAWTGELASRLPARRWTKLTPAFRGITIRDVIIEGCREMIDMKSIPESPVRYLQLENITLDMRQADPKIFDPNEKRLMLLRDVDGMSMRGLKLIGTQKSKIEVVDGRNLIFEDWTTEGITPEVTFEGEMTDHIRFYNCPGWEGFNR
ncbi:MAG: glycoside hydrolase family 28 protein [Rikenellaceae bacterium]|nr:glycoside hydrolase family 28 protein [Rikenellaceae bacterium]